ncbi:serine hydrolase FSH [Umbelopsis sp. PMI_123]|nr:serine hydrolase FSH [Umbelopsis sp. PMI_123]
MASAAAPPPSQSGKLRILCLHGWMQNTEVMTRNMGAIINRFKDSIDFVIPTGPFELPTAFKPGRPTNTPLAAWLIPQRTDDGNLHELDGFSDTIEFLVLYMSEQGPFDGILGFSQGAGLSVILMSILSHDEWRERYHVPSHVQPFRLGIILSGFVFMTPTFAEFYQKGKLTTPTMHVYSKEDDIISVDRALELIDTMFSDAVHASHELGHRIVATPSLIKQYERFFNRFVYIQPTSSL